MIVNVLVCRLSPGQYDLVCVDNHYVVASVDMGSERGLVLTTQYCSDL